MTIIVFSKDRAMQLDAFLQSYRDHLVPLLPVHVLYKASTDRHEHAYQAVFVKHDFVIPSEQGTLKDDILGLLTKSTVIFFVDDQIFVRPWRALNHPGLSLRLAPHLTRCYPMNADQPKPRFRSAGLDVWTWRWDEGQLDWGYPLSVDGHVFDAAEMREFITAIDFSTPNAFESQLQQFVPRFAGRLGLCYQQSKVVNVPWTKVQCENDNRFSGEATVDQMLASWEQGMRIDVAAFYGVVNESAHQEFPLSLVLR